MDNVTAYKSLETPVRWRTSLPGYALVGGMDNIIELRLQNTTNSADNVPMTPGKVCITMRHLPGGTELVQDFGEFLIHENTPALPVTLSVSEKVPRGYYRLHIVHRNKDDKPIGVYKIGVAVDSLVEPVDDNYTEIQSIRSQVADLCGDDNHMLDGLEFGVGDICDAADRCLQQWESTAPRVTEYNGSNFPYAELLRNGIIMMLMQSVCHLLGRNSMTYQAEGISVNLEQRLTYYNQLMAQYQTLWRSGMAQMKAEENAYAFINHLGYQ